MEFEMDLLEFNVVEVSSANENGSLPYSTGKSGSEILFDGFSPVLLNFASICCIVFMLLGIPGNLITIFALARCKKIRNATAIFIINLSCSDLLFCCFNLPLAASIFYHKEWIHGDIMCRLFPLFRYGLLAVSLFTILTITINRYVMIGHPRVYPGIYRRKNIFLMVCGTWLFCFSCLVPTWMEKWGKFGLDKRIGSCSIIPLVQNGSTPKEFLFLMAFALPCCAIVLCYARIFYIVRKTAFRANGNQLKPNGSLRLRNDPNGESNKTSASNEKPDRPLSPQKTDSISISSSRSNRESINGQRMKKLLSKTKEEDLKFIDTSVESDLPPTLSQLQRNSNRTSIRDRTPSIPSSITSTSIDAAIFQLERDRLREIDENRGTEGESREMLLDSAAGSSETNSPPNRNEKKVNKFNVEPERSSSSGIELPFDKDVIEKLPEIATKHAAKKKDTKITQKKLKEENQTKDVRKKSLANTSGASILYAGRMSSKDRRLLKMILVIFISFLTCYLPITLSKVFRSVSNVNFFHITSYLLVYLTTCINPMIYVVMSSEYRQAYKNLIMCRADSQGRPRQFRESKRR